TPDFRKTTLDDHVRLVGDLFEHLTGPGERIAEDWMAQGLGRLDRLDGEIETLSTRLAGVRTLAYVAHRPDWLADSAHWQGRARELEDRLSDTLHEKLMARFVDRRTSALLRGLGEASEVLAGFAADGEVTVEGFTVGRLAGLAFEPARGAGVLAQKALRRAAERVVAPEINRRLGALAAEPDEALAVNPDGLVHWRGAAAGAIAGGEPLAPSIRLLTEMGAHSARERAMRRLEAFVAGEGRRRFAALDRLSREVSGGTLRGLARGVAWRLAQAGGVIDRREVEPDLSSLSQAERRTLRALGVKIGAFCLWLPGQIDPAAAALATAFAAATPDSARLHGLMGLARIGPVTIAPDALERLAEAMRLAPRRGGGAVLDDAAYQRLGLAPPRAGQVLRALGFVPVGRREAGKPPAWRRRRALAAAAAPVATPFAALAGLDTPPARKPYRRRRARG
ncbi:MAG TPA: phosphonate-binding protein, partial [Caulobacteraceae bacterium]